LPVSIGCKQACVNPDLLNFLRRQGLSAVQRPRGCMLIKFHDAYVLFV
jgi:hypothetical protein